MNRDDRILFAFLFSLPSFSLRPCDERHRFNLSLFFFLGTSLSDRLHFSSTSPATRNTPRARRNSIATYRTGLWFRNGHSATGKKPKGSLRLSRSAPPDALNHGLRQLSQDISLPFRASWLLHYPSNVGQLSQTRIHDELAMDRRHSMADTASSLAHALQRRELPSGNSPVKWIVGGSIV